MTDSPVEIRWKISQRRTTNLPMRSTSFHFQEDKAARYTMGKVISSTYQSDIYVAYDTKHNNRKVVIKKPGKDIAFKSEVAALSKIYFHQNIICLLDFYTHNTEKMLVYEYFSGVDLIDWIHEYHDNNQKRSADIEDTMKPICSQILNAVVFCHAKGVAHRDIKLDNIRYNTKTGNIKLIDFGFAYVENSNMDGEQRCGSVEYAAPELLSPEIWPQVNPFKSDVWSFGVVVYSLTHFKTPYYFDEETNEFTLDFIRESFSDELKEVLDATLQEDLNERFSINDVKRLDFFSI